MEMHQIGIISETSGVSISELTRVSAALQKQAMRHFCPIWQVQATIDVFSSLEDLPLDYWPIIIRDDIKEQAYGIHLDKDGHPFSLVQFREGWSITASHESLEMLCDPFGNKTKSGISPKEGQGKVEFLVEVCDPSEDSKFGYIIDGIAVSDFYTPHFFDSVLTPGTRYSYTGAITEPRQVLKGGYLSWLDPVSDEWWQQHFFNSKLEFRNLGSLSQMEKGGIRAQIFRQTPEAFKVRVPARVEMQTRHNLLQAATNAGNGKAKILRQQINDLLKVPGTN